MTQGSAATQAFEKALSAAESALQHNLDALLTGEASDLSRLAGELLQALRTCAQLAPALSPPSAALQHRMTALGAGLAQFHSNLIRSQSLVAQQLRVLLPTNELATYGRGASSYVPGRSAASFTSLDA